VPRTPRSIAAVRRIVLLSLNDELVTAPSEAEEQANVYRELLNYSRSPELDQHITTRLTLLQAIGPNVRLRHSLPCASSATASGSGCDCGGTPGPD
jgi:hypothetical protein